MDFSSLSRKLNRFLYRRETGVLSEADLKMAEEWALKVIREHHPEWGEDQVRRYYDGLLRVRVYVVDEWGRRQGRTV